MGLAAPRKKIKLSHDPNNTKWSRDTEGFGHKLMTAQGWQPGEFLGVKDAPHAEFHTEASASHIRVFIKDDNLGLGAKRGSGLGEGECTGLDVFQSILGRLNGKDETELIKEQKSREELKRAIYTEQRWGSVRFVRGGFLVGNKIQQLIDDEAERVKQLDNPPNAVQDNNEDDSGEEPINEKATAKSKKSRKELKSESAMNGAGEESEEARSKRKAEKRRLKQERKDLETKERLAETDSSTEKKSKKKRSRDEPSEEALGTEDVTETREERKARRKAKKETKSSEAQPESEVQNEEKKHKKRRKEKAAEEGVSPIELPSASLSTVASTTAGATSQPTTPQGFEGARHAVRRRFIAQKRAAVMDIAALNQIFMIKS